MSARSSRRIPLVLLAVALGQAAAQQAADDAQDPAADPAAAAAAGGADAAPAETIGGDLESCFNSRNMIDISILSDQHMYVRTRGSNHYLITTEFCEGMERSYLHRTARLVPYGREVCLHDGSHIVYETGGQQRVCPIRGIELVDNRRQARDIVAGREPIVEFEELETEVEELPPE